MVWALGHLVRHDRCSRFPDALLYCWAACFRKLTPVIARPSTVNSTKASGVIVFVGEYQAQIGPDPLSLRAVGQLYDLGHKKIPFNSVEGNAGR